MVDSEGILEILNKLEDDDVFALAKTVTQNLLKLNTREGIFLYI